MYVGSAVPPQHIIVATEYDVTSMRQEVRRIARTLGLGLAEQAKIATAISTIARVLLVRYRTAMFTLQTTNLDARPALEIACTLGPAPADGAQLEQMLHLADVRLLVDEVTLVFDTGEAILRMRMRLERLAHG
jgi:hypothetical protein